MRGPHPSKDEEVPVPQATVGGVYLLSSLSRSDGTIPGPGDKASGRMVRARGKKNGTKYSRSWFYLQPGNADEPCVIVNIKIEGHPVRRQIDESGDWIRLQSGCYATIEVERPYPSSFRWLHAELRMIMRRCIGYGCTRGCPGHSMKSVSARVGPSDILLKLDRNRYRGCMQPQCRQILMDDP
jgi:hypothetical protein